MDAFVRIVEPNMTNTTSDARSLLQRGSHLRLRHILQLIPMSKTAWWDSVRAGRLPKPIKISPRVAVWRSEDIQRLLDMGG